MMKFYNRRLVTLAKRRLATGYYGRRNAGWRELYDGFVPDIRLRKLIRKGLLRWWKCELVNLGLMLRSRKRKADIGRPPSQRKAVRCRPERQRRISQKFVRDSCRSSQTGCDVLPSAAFSGGNISTGRSATFPFYFLPRPDLVLDDLFFLFRGAGAPRRSFAIFEVILPGSSRLMNYLRAWRTLYNFAWTITEGSQLQARTKSQFVYEIEGEDRSRDWPRPKARSCSPRTWAITIWARLFSPRNFSAKFAWCARRNRIAKRRGI